MGIQASCRGGIQQQLALVALFKRESFHKLPSSCTTHSPTQPPTSSIYQRRSPSHRQCQAPVYVPCAEQRAKGKLIKKMEVSRRAAAATQTRMEEAKPVELIAHHHQRPLQQQQPGEAARQPSSPSQCGDVAATLALLISFASKS